MNMWKNNSTPECQDPITRETAMLGKPKINDAQDRSKEFLDAAVANRTLNADTYKKLAKFEASLDKRVLAFIEKAPTYGSDPKEVFNW